MAVAKKSGSERGKQRSMMPGMDRVRPGGTEENWLKNAAAALGARSIYQRNRVFAETQKHDLLNVC